MKSRTMQVPNILNLIATAVLLRVACAGRDAVPNTNAKVTERQQVQEQIVGPESFDIREGEYNFVSLLQTPRRRSDGAIRPDGNVCTGALITKRHVVTAAHCCWNSNVQAYYKVIDVTVAAHTLGPGGTQQAGSGQLSKGAVSFMKTGKRVWTPWLYDVDTSLIKDNAHWDICIIDLEEDVDPAIALPVQFAAKHMEDVPVNTTATLIGWGQQTPLTGGAVTQLRGINVSVIPCEDDKVGGDAWKGDKWESGRRMFICTAKTAGGGCGGDSGGPLLVDGILRGIYLMRRPGTGTGNSCMYPDEDMDTFLNVSSPEIFDFVEDIINPTSPAPVAV